MILTNLDRHLLRRAAAPMSAVLISTMVAFLMERLMRSFQLLAQTTEGFGFLAKLLVNLLPHYVGLTLPGGFFIGLFVVIDGLNKGSEIDAMLAGGISLGRLAAPFVGLGIVLMLFSAALFGFIQPYSRYAYHTVLNAAAAAGWNGVVRPRAVLAAGPGVFLTADDADASGRRLARVFVRKLDPEGREDLLTAVSADVLKARGAREVTFVANDGRLVSTTRDGRVYVTDFATFTFDLPLPQSAGLPRARGDETSELTLIELARLGLRAAEPALPREALLAELFSRVSRALILPLLPLLAVPFGLSAKRAGSGPTMVIGGLMLFGFETAMVLGKSMTSPRLPAAVTIGAPTAVFATACVAAWIASRKRPGQNPVSWLAERVAEGFAAIARIVGQRRALPE